MAIYIISFLSILLCDIVQKFFNVKKSTRNTIVAWFSAIIILLIFALRHPSMGIDLKFGNDQTGYISRFYVINQQFKWSKILVMGMQNYETGYIVFNKLVGSIWLDHQFFLACVAAVSIFPVISTIKKYSENVAFSIIIWMGMLVFGAMFSALRQVIAVSIVFFAFRYVVQKKILHFCFFILLAQTFHSSAIIGLVIYPMFYIKDSDAIKVISFAILMVVHTFKVQIYKFGCYITNTPFIIESGGSGLLFVIFLLIYVAGIFAIRIYKPNAAAINSPKRKMAVGTLNIFYIAVVFQLFGDIFSIAGRIGYYFMIFPAIFLPLLTQRIKNRNNKIGMLIEIAIGLCFVVLGFYILYTGSWQMAYPYRFFWQ